VLSLQSLKLAVTDGVWERLEPETWNLKLETQLTPRANLFSSPSDSA
jgi:hypothetical protein